MYLNAYITTLQLPGHLVTFLVKHRQQPIPSPALLSQLTRGFVSAVESFAQERGIPIVHFQKVERKEEVAVVVLPFWVEEAVSRYTVSTAIECLPDNVKEHLSPNSGYTPENERPVWLQNRPPPPFPPGRSDTAQTAVWAK